MGTSEVQKILGYLNIGLAIAQDAGVTIGHFGSTDFVQLAQMVNTLLLTAIEPTSSTAVSATGSTGSTAVAVSAAPVASSAPAVSVAPAACVVAVS